MDRENRGFSSSGGDGRESRRGLNPLLPHNNRVHSSAALQMTGIWTKTIGYDPYAQDGDQREDEEAAAASRERARGIMALATLSNRGNEARGACKKCGMMGHLTFQCRNFALVEDKKSDDDDSSSSSSESEAEDARRKRRREPSPERKSASKKKRKRSRSPEAKKAKSSKKESKKHKKHKKDSKKASKKHKH
ncbi:Aste57867_17128 [Aphanomyces stellatus]|uniref:Aste57867_17128 protein n=1 Tax=Aphanomyces stellatus TaxID=120398 RepID=A0A485L726_9STRA|nr:hypothetical protein As57867_017069 [Aphanomyces stellatus]VFT93886.1 Aste57867_17128 [Aphanomyces stellatus]